MRAVRLDNLHNTASFRAKRRFVRQAQTPLAEACESRTEQLNHKSRISTALQHTLTANRNKRNKNRWSGRARSDSHLASKICLYPLFVRERSNDVWKHSRNRGSFRRPLSVVPRQCRSSAVHTVGRREEPVHGWRDITHGERRVR